jgi:hypothetical protein
MFETGGGPRFIVKALELPRIEQGRERERLEGHAPAE